MQLLSIHLFRDVMRFVAEAERRPLKTHVHQSLLPLLCHLHDENQRVAEVRISDLLVSPWEAARLPPALAPHGLQRSSLLLALATEQQLWGPLSCCPGSTRCPRWGLPHASARAPKPLPEAFPSCCVFPPRARKGPEPCPGAGDAGPVPWAAVPSPGLCCSAGLSGNPASSYQVPEEQEAQAAAGEGADMGGRRVPGKDGPKAPDPAWTSPLPPRPSVWGWRLCPCPLLQPIAASLQPTHAPFPRACGPTGSSPGSSPSPSPGVLTEPRPSWALAAAWHRSSPGSSQPSAPSKPRHQPAAGWASWVSWQGRPVLGAGTARPRGRVCTNPSLRSLTLSPAGRIQQQSGRVPAAVPAVPAEPTGVHARGGHQVPW